MSMHSLAAKVTRKASIQFMNFRAISQAGQAISCLAFIALVACAPNKQNEISHQTAKASDAIINGQVVDPTSELASSIVGIFDASRGGICTGSLLANNIVLTAAHCVGAQTDKIIIIFDADMMGLIKSNDRERLIKSARRVNAVRIHQGWDLAKANKKPDTWDDIALIRFSGSVPSGFKPAELLSNARELNVDTKVILAGYGVNQMEIIQVDPKSRPDLADATSRGEIFCDAARTQCVSLKSSGSGLLRSTEVPIAKVLAKEVVVNQRAGSGACSGDSGGPAYLLKDGKYYLWGITSRGTPGCNYDGVYTNALTYSDWMKDLGPDGF